MLSFTTHVPSVPDPLGKYANVVTAPAPVETVHISGQVGMDADGNVVGSDLASQTRATFRNIGLILASLNLGPTAIAKLLTFAVGSDLTGFYQARDETYAEWYPSGLYPGHSLAVVTALAKPELLIEIEGIAYRYPEQQGLNEHGKNAGQ